MLWPITLMTPEQAQMWPGQTQTANGSGRKGQEAGPEQAMHKMRWRGDQLCHWGRSELALRQSKCWDLMIFGGQWVLL